MWEGHSQHPVPARSGPVAQGRAADHLTASEDPAYLKRMVDELCAIVQRQAAALHDRDGLADQLRQTAERLEASIAAAAESAAVLPIIAERRLAEGKAVDMPLDRPLQRF